MTKLAKPKIRRSRVGVYPIGSVWAYRVEAPNGASVSQNCFPDEASARHAGERQARFYDDIERYRVLGVPERRMKRPVERGLRICEDCGEPHDCYEIRQGRHKRRSWAHPEDGHGYRAESWETFALRLLDEKVAA